MMPERRDRLLTALRDGSYAQVQDHLRRDAGYCVLGVMIDLAFQQGLEGRWVYPQPCQPSTGEPGTLQTCSRRQAHSGFWR